MRKPNSPDTDGRCRTITRWTIKKPMKKLAYYPMDTMPVTLIQNVHCSFCLLQRECATPIALGPGEKFPYVCSPCATMIVKIIKKHGIIPGQQQPSSPNILSTGGPFYVGGGTSGTVSGTQAISMSQSGYASLQQQNPNAAPF